MALAAAPACVPQVVRAAPLWEIRGTVILAPTCSGPSLEAKECSQPWVDAPVQLLDRQGQLVMPAQRTTATGGFSFRVPAGQYQLSVQTNKITRCTPVDIELPAMNQRAVTVDCDTGRR